MAVATITFFFGSFAMKKVIVTSCNRLVLFGSLVTKKAIATTARSCCRLFHFGFITTKKVMVACCRCLLLCVSEEENDDN
jgi:hypothetical protein